jgi:cytochrome c-type protein NapC
VVLYPVAGLSAVFLAGMIFWGGFNWSLELTNTETFCTACHVMREFPYKEYQNTIHFSNRTGIRASCSDCHVPRKWIYKVSRKIRATNELYHWIIGSIDTPEEFEAKRPEMARKVWASMEQSNSRECRNCHGIDFMNQKIQTAKASVMHTLAKRWKKTCIDCHKGIAHALPRDFDKTALMGELHDRMAKEKIDCRQCHKGIAGAKAGDGW